MGGDKKGSGDGKRSGRDRGLKCPYSDQYLRSRQNVLRSPGPFIKVMKSSGAHYESAPSPPVPYVRCIGRLRAADPPLPPHPTFDFRDALETESVRWKKAKDGRMGGSPPPPYLSLCLCMHISAAY